MASLRVQEKRWTSRLTSAPSMIAAEGSEPCYGFAGSLAVLVGVVSAAERPCTTKACGSGAATIALICSRAS